MNFKSILMKFYGKGSLKIFKIRLKNFTIFQSSWFIKFNAFLGGPLQAERDDKRYEVIGVNYRTFFYDQCFDEVSHGLM